MKIKRWAILTAVFVFLGGAIVASGCQTNNTASTNNMLTTSQDGTTDCELCNNCSVAGKTYDCNNPDERNEYINTCTSNCDYNGRRYDCTTPLGCAGFWTAFGCNVCMQICSGNGDENSNANN